MQSHKTAIKEMRSRYEVWTWESMAFPDFSDVKVLLLLDTLLYYKDTKELFIMNGDGSCGDGSCGDGSCGGGGLARGFLLSPEQRKAAIAAKRAANIQRIDNAKRKVWKKAEPVIDRLVRLLNDPDQALKLIFFAQVMELCPDQKGRLIDAIIHRKRLFPEFKCRVEERCFPELETALADDLSSRAADRAPGGGVGDTGSGGPVAMARCGSGGGSS